MKKLFTNILTFAFLICCLCTLTACFGNDSNDNGDEGDDTNPVFYFSINDTQDGYYVTNYNGEDTEVTIPETYKNLPVVGIRGNSLFRDSAVTKVVIPNSVVEIGDSIFYDATNLTEVVFPENLVSIGNRAFQNTKLTKVNLPATITDIGYNAFEDTTTLEEFTIAKDAPIDSIKQSAFEGCTSLRVVELSDNITTLGYRAFGGCSSLVSIDLKHVKEVSSRCFEECTKLKNVDFGDSLEEIGSEAFEETALESVVLPETCKEIDSFAFGTCLNLKSVYIPSSVKDLGGVFAKSYNIETLTMPAGSGTMGNIFQYTSWNYDDESEVLVNLTTLNLIGNSKIYNSFATNLSKLQNITLEDTIIEVGSDCFTNTAWFNSQPDGLVYAGKVLLGYKGTASTGMLNVKSDTLGIASKAFINCDGILGVTLPQNLKIINEAAFSGCTGISSITLPEKLIMIGKEAFKSCGMAGELSLPLIETIGENAFLGCAITSVEFGDKLTTIGKSAFQNCDITGDLVIPSSVTSLGQWALRGNNNISKLTLVMPDITLGLLFYNIPNSLTEVVINGSNLPDGALSNARGVTKVTLSQDITVISRSAFSSCASLTEINLDNITEIKQSAFSWCSSLTEITMPSTLTAIGDLAFNYCTKLGKIVLNDGLKTIGDKAFSNCKLDYLIIPSSVTYVGEEIVYGLDTGKMLNFKIFVEATSAQDTWSKYWNANTVDTFTNEDGEVEEIINCYPTYYYSELEPSEEGNFWHYENGLPVIW